MVLQILPKKITKETIFEKLNLFSDNENIKCKYYKTEHFKENGFDKHNQMNLLQLNIEEEAPDKPFKCALFERIKQKCT